MADPITGMMAVGMATSAAGGIIGGIGAQQQAGAQSQAYQYKAQIALMNKQINEQNARWALEAGGIKAQQAGMKSGQDIANTKVAQSASGLDVNTGSNEAVRETQSEVAQFDQNVIRFDAKKTAYGYLTKAATSEAEANLDTASASNARDAGDIAMWSSFITGASNVSGKWMQARTIGIGSNAASSA